MEEKKKGRLHAKLKLMRIVSAVFAVLFIVAAAFSVFSFIQLRQLREDNSAFRQQIDSIGEQLDSVKQQSGRLQTELDQKLQDYSELQSLYRQNEEKAAALQAQLDALESAEGTVQSLTVKAQRLEEQLEALRQTNTALTKQIIELQKQIAESDGSESHTSQYTEGGKYAFLTFDDGVSKYTDTILDILNEYGVKATFFPNWKKNNAAKYRRIVSEGHTIGNHTYSHDWDTLYKIMDGQTAEDRADFLLLDIQKLQTEILENTGVLPTFFRFPGGSDATIRNAEDVIPVAIPQVKEMGLIYCDWNVDSGDASSSKGLSSDQIVKNVMNRVYKGNGTLRSPAVILMHDTGTKGTTVEALPRIIEGLVAKGYTILPLDPTVPVPQSLKV